MSQENNELLGVLENYSHFSSKASDKTKKMKSDFVLKDLLVKFGEKKVKANEICKVLNVLNPYLIDLEIRNLDPILNGSNELLTMFLSFILESLKEKHNFEMVNSYLNRFLKLFSNNCLDDGDMMTRLNEINGLVMSETNDMEFIFNNILSMITHFGQIQI